MLQSVFCYHNVVIIPSLRAGLVLNDRIYIYNGVGGGSDSTNSLFVKTSETTKTCGGCNAKRNRLIGKKTTRFWIALRFWKWKRSWNTGYVVKLQIFYQPLFFQPLSLFKLLVDPKSQTSVLFLQRITEAIVWDEKKELKSKVTFLNNQKYLKVHNKMNNLSAF